MKGVQLLPPHFHKVQMGGWHREAMTEGFVSPAKTPPTRLRRATSPFVPAGKMERNS